jgi:hypothetical protein
MISIYTPGGSNSLKTCSHILQKKEGAPVPPCWHFFQTKKEGPPGAPVPPFKTGRLAYCPR